MDRCDDNIGKPLSGRTVLACLLAFFIVVASVNGVMMAAAITTFGGVETASSYQAGLAFAREISAVRAQQHLGWNVSVETSGSARTTVIEIAARDRDNLPLAGLRTDGRLSHPLDRRLDRALVWREVARGVFRAETERASGQWDLVFELAQGGRSTFRSRNRLTFR